MIIERPVVFIPAAVVAYLALVSGLPLPVGGPSVSWCVHVSIEQAARHRHRGRHERALHLRVRVRRLLGARDHRPPRVEDAKRPETRGVPRRPDVCPTDDVGGSWGYEHLLAVLADPTHEEHEHLSQWVGRPVDPAEFDLALVNAHLQMVR